MKKTCRATPLILFAIILIIMTFAGCAGEGGTESSKSTSTSTSSKPVAQISQTDSENNSDISDNSNVYYRIEDDFSVKPVRKSDGTGFVLYDEKGEELMCALEFPEEVECTEEYEVILKDHDEDGFHDIGFYTAEGYTVWFVYWPEAPDEESVFIYWDYTAPDDITDDSSDYIDDPTTTEEFFIGTWVSNYCLMSILDDGTFMVDTVNERYLGDFYLDSEGNIMLNFYNAEDGAQDIVWYGVLGEADFMTVEPISVGNSVDLHLPDAAFEMEMQ